MSLKISTSMSCHLIIIPFTMCNDRSQGPIRVETNINEIAPSVNYVVNLIFRYFAFIGSFYKFAIIHPQFHLPI